ncbi:hypothetical protein ABZ552_08920 [Nocardia sp. NPDC019219]|uniref:hypothetical protein n=1 Tax=Nocardia sp. NPDC019219 TaxID=3154590 RepID=UPI0033C9E207
MTAAHDYEAVHHMVDRLSPAQVRRLRLLVSEPEQAETDDAELLQAVTKLVRALGIAHDVGKASEKFASRRRSLGFIGTLDAEPELAEKSGDLIRKGMGSAEC